MQRVGWMYNATSESVDISLESPHAYGLCLGHATIKQEVEGVRDHMGGGIQISCEGKWRVDLQSQ